MNNNRYLTILLIVAMFFNILACNNKNKEKATVINQLRSSAKLATVEYIVTKVIRAKKNNFLLKDAYFFAESQASIKAGIDLDKLKEQDIEVDPKNNKVSIKLPPVEIINFSYPVDSFKINYQYTQNPKLSIGKISVADIDTLYKMGESDIHKNIDKLGITKTAEINTKKLLTSILETLGFTEIYIEFRPAEKLSAQNGKTSEKSSDKN